MIELSDESASGYRRATLFGIDIDRVTMREAIEQVNSWLADSEKSCRYIVTPNVHHILLLQHNHAMREAYRHASLVVADGWPLVTVSRLLGHSLPERVTGSDMVPDLLTTGRHATPLRVFLLGAAPGVGEKAANRIHARCPYTRVVGTYAPPPGFETDSFENRDIVRRINESNSELLIVGFGAPKQEIWLHQHHRELRCRVAIAAGASIDFLAGRQRRAPRWIQKLRLEWFYRAITNPRRLAPRYLRDAMLFAPLLWKEWQAQRQTYLDRMP